MGPLERHRRSVTSDEVHTAARAEADDRAPHRDLHPIDELTVAVYNVINWSGVDLFYCDSLRPHLSIHSRRHRSNPHIPMETGADRAGEKGRLVVRELARRDEA